MDRLLREGNPPAGQLASPKPQYKKPGVDEYAPVEGQHGAPFAILKDASGNVISPATDAKLEQVKSELELVKSELQTIKANQLSGDQKVQLSGTIVSAPSVGSMEVAAGARVLVFEDNSGLFSKAMFLIYPITGSQVGKLYESYKVGTHGSVALEREIPTINRGGRILTEQPYPLLSPHWVRIYWENTSTGTQTISRFVTWFYGR